MSTITKEFTKEQLIERLQHRISVASGFPESEKAQMDLELARIALASLEAEPVAYIIQDAQARGRGRPGFLSFDASISDEDINEYEISVTPLYTAPQLPQPAVPDEDLLHMAASAIDDLLSNKDRSGAGVWADIPAKLRRAAMLQGAEPASNRDELPLDYLQGHKDGLEWAAQLAEANHPQTGDWLYDDPIDLARAIRKCPDMPTAQAGNHTEQHLDMVDHSGDANKMVAGNSPLVPDGWVACSERMPEEGSKVIVFRPRASESNDPTVKTATYKGGREYYHGFDCYCEPTHWMPLPAAPQQEVKP